MGDEPYSATCPNLTSGEGAPLDALPRRFLADWTAPSTCSPGVN